MTDWTRLPIPLLLRRIAADPDGEPLARPDFEARLYEPTTEEERRRTTSRLLLIRGLR